MGFPRVWRRSSDARFTRVERAGIPVRLFVHQADRGDATAGTSASRRRRDRVRSRSTCRTAVAHRALHHSGRGTGCVRARDQARASPAAARPRRRGQDRAHPPSAQGRRRTLLLRPAQDLHQGAAAGDRARGPAPRSARGPPPARALRPRHDDRTRAGCAAARALTVLVHRLAKDFTPALIPAAVAAAEASRPALRRHVHRANVRHLRRSRRRAGAPLYHGLSPDFARLLAHGPRPPGGSARSACAAWPPSPRRASTCWSSAWRCCGERGRGRRRAIVGQETSTAARAAARGSRQRGLERQVRLTADEPGQLLDRPARARSRLPAASAAGRRPRRHPQRARRGDGLRACRSSRPRSPASRARHRRHQRPAGRPRRPGRAGRRATPLARARRPAPTTGRAGAPRPSSSASTATGSRGELAGSLLREATVLTAPFVRRDQCYCVIADGIAIGAACGRAAAASRHSPRRQPRPRARSPAASASLRLADEEWRSSWVELGTAGLDLDHAPPPRGDGVPAQPGSGSCGSYRRRCRPARRPKSPPGAALTWMFAWQRFRDARRPRQPRLLAGLGAAGRPRRTTTSRPERNHRTLELYALLIVALALPPLDPDASCWPSRSPGWRPTCRPDFRAGRRRSVRPRATPLHRPALVRGARENCRRYGPRASSAALDAAARTAPATSPCTCTGPTAAIPALSDADARRSRDCSAWPRDPLDRDELRHAASAGRVAARRGTGAPSSPPAATTAAQRLGDGARAFADDASGARLRPARRRRPRPLRPAGVELCRRRAAGGRPGPLHLRRGRAEPAPLVQGHRGAQHGVVDGLDQTPVPPRRQPRAGAEASFLAARRGRRHPARLLAGRGDAAPATRRPPRAGSRSSPASTG